MYPPSTSFRSSEGTSVFRHVLGSLTVRTFSRQQGQANFHGHPWIHVEFYVCKSPQTAGTEGRSYRSPNHLVDLGPDSRLFLLPFVSDNPGADVDIYIGPR